MPISVSTANSLKKTGGSGTVLGEARIKTPFVALDMVIDVTISMLEEDVPLLLSHGDMIENKLYISLQGRYLHNGTRRQPLGFKNYL